MRRYLIYIIIAVVVIFGIQQTISIIRTESQKSANTKQTEILPINESGSVSTLTILPLYDKNTDNPAYQTGAGVSYLIKAGQSTLLMDIGDNPGKSDPSPLESNMKVAGVSVDQLDLVVISHLHPDHMGGLQNWLDKTVSIGKNTILPLTLPIYLPETTVLEGDRGKVVTLPTKLAEGVVSLGAITFNNPLPISFMRPTSAEQSLAVKVDGLGVIVITGCGHPGLQTILNRAEKVMGEPVVGVVGGLHYQKGIPDQIAADSQLLKDRNIRLLAISPHDSDPAVITEFRTQFGNVYQDILVGQPITIQP